jgi:hypothetical protein
MKQSRLPAALSRPDPVSVIPGRASARTRNLAPQLLDSGFALRAPSDAQLRIGE